MSPTTITFLVLAATVAVFVWDRIPVAIVALGVALSLWATDVLTLEQSLAGFGDPTVIFIASLFVVSEGLDAAGVTTWAGQQLLAQAGESRARLLVLTMLLVAAATALISVNGAVAALLPVAVVTAGVFLVTTALGQLISNMATALIVIPVAVSAAAELDVSAKPVLMAVAVSAAAAYLTPVATPANLMVMGPGGYRFGDYWRLGLPLLLLHGLAAVLLVPLIWRL